MKNKPQTETKKEELLPEIPVTKAAAGLITAGLDKQKQAEAELANTLKAIIAGMGVDTKIYALDLSKMAFVDRKSVNK